MSEKFLVNYKALGEKIKQKRNQLGMTQEKVSERLDLSESYYSRIEAGNRVTSIETLMKIANFYNLSLDYLMLDSSTRQANDKVQTELMEILKNKTQAQSKYLLDILRVLSNNIEELYP